MKVQGGTSLVAGARKAPVVSVVNRFLIKLRTRLLEGSTWVY